MAKKKLRFPLKMNNEKKVYSFEELRENFSLARTYYYISNGRFSVWLRDREFDVIADEIEALSFQDEAYFEKVCELLDIDIDEKVRLEIESLKNQGDFEQQIKKEATECIELVKKICQTLEEQMKINNLG